VLGADPSSIPGRINANGNVFLVNPHGIVFGSGASVNVGGLVASALNSTGVSFTTGSYQFAGGGGRAIHLAPWLAQLPNERSSSHACSRSRLPQKLERIH
jgi:filamentous hemagglutinin family protein